MRSTDDYLELVPPLNANKPNFMATIAATVASFADQQTFLANLNQAFDLDLAEGAQLDVVGQWVGQSRNVTIPVAQPWFAWGTLNRGWSEGYWRGPNINANYISSLDDVTYLRLLEAKIAANYGAGTVASAQAALDLYFINPATNLWVQDISDAVYCLQPFSWGVALSGWGQGYWRVPGDVSALAIPTQPSVGMHWQVGISGLLPSIVDLEILAQNLIPVAPAGVDFDVKVTTVNGAPLFGWGLENEFVSGWGVGAWGASPDFVAQNILNV